jgi:Flp pilus assembly pilin Flp
MSESEPKTRVEQEGNVRRIIIRNDKGATLVELPLTVGVIGAALLPVLAAVGAIAAIATDCELVVERVAE